MTAKLTRFFSWLESHLPDVEVAIGVCPFAWRLRWNPTLWEADAIMGWEWDCHVCLGPLRSYVCLGLPWTRRKPS